MRDFVAFAPLFLLFNYIGYSAWEAVFRWAAAGEWDRIIRLSPLVLILSIAPITFWRIGFELVRVRIQRRGK